MPGPFRMKHQRGRPPLLQVNLYWAEKEIPWEESSCSLLPWLPTSIWFKLSIILFQLPPAPKVAWRGFRSMLGWRWEDEEKLALHCKYKTISLFSHHQKGSFSPTPMSCFFGLSLPGIASKSLPLLGQSQAPGAGGGLSLGRRGGRAARGGASPVCWDLCPESISSWPRASRCPGHFPSLGLFPPLENGDNNAAYFSGPPRE